MKVEYVGRNPYTQIARKEGSEGRGDSSFTDVLQGVIRRLREVEKVADEEVERLARMETKDVHTAMIAIEKADLTFQLMLQIRNKIIQAYEEIMRMQV